MKKLFSFALSLVFVFALSCSAMATNVGSMTNVVDVAKDQVFTGTDNQDYKVVVEASVDAEEQEAGVQPSDSAMQSMTGENADNMKVLWAANLVLRNVDTGERLSDAIADGKLSFPIRVSMDVSALKLKADSKCYLFHYSSVDKKWELIETSLSADGKVLTGTFNSLSPVALVVVDENNSGANGGSSSGDSSTDKDTSPKTGDSIGIVFAFGVAVAASASACALYRKRG